MALAAAILSLNENKAFPIFSCRFPEKCVILLGNEKEGIPGPLLRLLDVCLEIPQVGVIRSLNVHVSGAVTLWEYAKQRVLSNVS